MFRNMKPIGGMLMAVVLMMRAFNPQSFTDAAGRVTVTHDMLHHKGAACRLYVAGRLHKLTPGTYDNALLLVRESGTDNSEAHCRYGLYVDA